MPTTIIKDVKYVTQLHFRPNERARLKGLKILVQNGKNRLHFHIEYEDGVEDFVSVFNSQYYSLECSESTMMREPVEG